MLLPLVLGLLATPSFVAPDDPTDWVEVRAADAFARAAFELGLPVLLPRAVAGPAVEASKPFVVRAQAEAQAPMGPLRVSVRWEGQSVHHQTTLRELDDGGRALALGVARTLGEGFQPGSWPLRRIPWPVERRLGQARVRELAGQWTQAQLAFERAATIPGGVWWSALDGAARCRKSLRPELAQAAAARGRVAARGQDWQEATEAWMSVLKYTPRRGRRWVLAGPFGQWRPAGADGGALYGEADGAGLVVELAPARAALRRIENPFVAVAPSMVVQRGRGGTLERAGRWRRRVDRQLEAFRLVGGHLAAWGRAGLTWLDPTTGRPTGRVPGPVLAVGPRGVLAQREDAVTLTRPGQEAPAWRSSIGRVREGAVTGERVLLLIDDRVLVLRARDGKTILDQALGPALRILKAEGRQALLADGERLVILDSLGGKVVADARGPDRVVGGAVHADGSAASFASGDVLLFDRAGALSARARLPVSLSGADHQAEHPKLLTVTSPGALVGLDLGGHAPDGFAAALLELARAQQQAGDESAALELANAAAAAVFGPVEAAERLRAELLPPGPARTWAQVRARAAADTTRPLPYFRALGSPQPVDTKTQSTTTEAED